MSANPTYALIIGVDNYRAFDPSGGNDLRGAINDAKRWHRMCVHNMTLGADQMQLCLAPAPDQSAPKASGATRADIVAGLKWLAGKLAGGDSSGLLTFSGHGVNLSGSGHFEEGLSLGLCPTDVAVEDGAVVNTLSFAQIEVILHNTLMQHLVDVPNASEQAKQQANQKANQALENLTVVLDACYSRSGRSSRSLKDPPKTASLGNRAPHRVFSRLVLASELNESAYEITTSGGVVHGALSFAMQTMMEQWSSAVDGKTGVRYLRASYGDLVYRTRQMVEAMGVPQSPNLSGSMDNVSLLPVLRPGGWLMAGQTSPTPDGWRLREQFSGGNNGVVILSLARGNTLMGYGVIPDSSQTVTGSYTPTGGSSTPYSDVYTNTSLEYWTFNKTALKNQVNLGNFSIKIEFNGAWPEGDGSLSELDNLLNIGWIDDDTQSLTPTQSATWTQCDKNNYLGSPAGDHRAWIRMVLDPKSMTPLALQFRWTKNSGALTAFRIFRTIDDDSYRLLGDLAEGDVLNFQTGDNVDAPPPVADSGVTWYYADNIN